MTECALCRLRFAGTSAFDRHRIGKHAYTFREGLALDPPVDDGRRCAAAEEMVSNEMELDERGQWRIIASDKQLAGLARMRAGAATNAQEPIPGLAGTSGRAA